MMMAADEATPTLRKALALGAGSAVQIVDDALRGADLGKNLWIKRNFEARLRGDSASRAAFYKSLWDMGVLSPNDINRLEDRPDVPGGDVRMARLDSVPLENFREISLANARNKSVENEMT